MQNPGIRVLSIVSDTTGSNRVPSCSAGSWARTEPAEASTQTATNVVELFVCALIFVRSGVYFGVLAETLRRGGETELAGLLGLVSDGVARGLVS